MESWKVTAFPSDKAKICTWNVNGIRAVMGKGELQNFLKNEDPDVLCINETKIDEGKLQKEKLGAQLFPDKYLQFWNCCKSASGYAGTAIFSKVKPVDVKFDLGITKHDLEGRTITVEFDKFIVVACYVPNAGQKLDRLDYRTKEWDLDFRAYLKNMEQIKQKCVILCGDLNVAHKEIDISNPKGNLRSAGFTVEERKEFTNFLEMGFVDSFRQLHPTEVKYSYWNMRSGARKENKGWRLDYFAVSASLMSSVEESDMLSKVMGSDHCPLILKLNLPTIQKPGVSGPVVAKPVAVEEEKKQAEPKKGKSSAKKGSAKK
jgi:exodeoxyribonuclease III